MELALPLRVEIEEDWGHLKVTQGWKQKELLPAEFYLLWKVRCRLASLGGRAGNGLRKTGNMD